MALPDPVATAQAIPWAMGIGATIAAYPVWHAATRAIDAAFRRWGDGARTAMAAFTLATLGGLPAGLALLFAIGLGADAVSALQPRPRCVIERFKPDGTSAGVMFLDGSCPERTPR